MADVTTPERSAPLAGLLVEGGRARQALQILDHEAPAFATALRRAVPVFVRRDVAVTAAPSRLATLAELMEDSERPCFVTPLALEPGGSRAYLVFDAVASVSLLEALLGGSLDEPPAPAMQLTAPQRALLGRVAEGVVQTLSNVLTTRFGARLNRLPGGGDEAPGGPGGAGASTALCLLKIGEEGRLGHVGLVLPADILTNSKAPAPGGGPDAKVAALLGAVDLDVVVELGRVSLKLEQLTALRPGDTLRLDTPVEGAVLVRAGQRAVFEGQPTTQRGQLAVRVLGRVGT
ncbi:MAG: FliM/FliN family flagellar motor switch protein [Polyangiaceae bacterium]|jgi:flagellar motor switch protein FliM|nr:FliM/FliN family flagellar motor switch protein [Polyangiaceae bacterium]